MIGKRKLGVKLVAVIISMLMVFQILPLTAFANEYQNNLLLQSSVDLETSYDDLAIEEEVIEERDEFSKTYLLENGIYCTLTSSSPVHKKVNNEWIEINSSDNELMMRQFLYHLLQMIILIILLRRLLMTD